MNDKKIPNQYKISSSFSTKITFLAIFLFVWVAPQIFILAKDMEAGGTDDNADIQHYRPEDEICKYFLTQLAEYIFGPKKIPILEDAAHFKRFVDNFKYDPKRLVRDVPLPYTETINKYVVSIMEAFSVDYEALIFTSQKEILVPIKTIRGIYFLCISKLSFTESIFEHHMNGYHFYFLEMQPFLKNLLMNQHWLDQILESRAFLNYLIPDNENLNDDLFETALFFITDVKTSYDISGVTGEARYFMSDLNKRKDFSFFSLPIIEFDHVDVLQPRHPFVKMTDPGLLKRCMELMSKEAPNAEELFFSTTLTTYLNSTVRSEFSDNFKDVIQSFLTENNFTINFDVLVSDWEKKIYENLKVFLFSNGVFKVEQLLQRPDFLRIVIERFFVLGTTYFFRSWSSIEDWIDWAKEWQKRNAGNPESALKALFCATSTGEEVLSFAFTLLDLGIENFYILGSDINQEFVRRSMEMTYSKESFERLPMRVRKDVLSKYFVKTNNSYRVKDHTLNEKILYRVWDITKPLPPVPENFGPPYDLISCQNVLLYLNPKSAHDTYETLLEMQKDRGLFILVDKNTSHLTSLKNNCSQTLLLNDYLLEKYEGVTKETVFSRAKKSEEFAPITQWVQMEKDDDTVWDFLNDMLDKPGNHVLVYFHMINLLVENKKYEKAFELISEAIKHYPLLQNLYKQAYYVSVQLQDELSTQYFKYLDEATSMINRIFQSTDVEFREVRKLFIKLLNLKQGDGLGHIAYGSHLIQYSLYLQEQGYPLIDYEKYLSEAFRSFLFVKEIKDFEEASFGGMNEIALILAKIHQDLNNHELAARVLYNAYYQTEERKIKFKDFKCLFSAAVIKLKLGESFFMTENYKSADLVLNLALQQFQEASKYVKNHKPRLIYEYYVQYANLWYTLSVYLDKNKNSILKYSQSHCVDMAMTYIDLALKYNSVYGIEAIQIRDALFRSHPEMLNQYAESYN